MTTHAMIDLETLSTNPDATILTVGGVKFDVYNALPFIIRMKIIISEFNQIFLLFF